MEPRNRCTHALCSRLPSSLISSDQLSVSRLEDFLKELPTVIKQAEPKLTVMLKHEVALARQLKLRELQTSFVYSTVLAKKSKVKLRYTSSACLTLGFLCLH